uniref:Secreted protein n=1 Tax=Megaselia scalaris TaxID=36166 RepID=T1GAK9_MEGSC
MRVLFARLVMSMPSVVMLFPPFLALETLFLKSHELDDTKWSNPAALPLTEPRHLYFGSFHSTQRSFPLATSPPAIFQWHRFSQKP